MNRQQRRRAEREDRTENDIEATMLAERVKQMLPTTGNVRFICECGERFPEGGMAVMHALEGHEVVRERYSLGQWYFHDTVNGHSVAEMIWNVCKAEGEDPQAFLERIQGLIVKKEEELAAIETAEREMGVR